MIDYFKKNLMDIFKKNPSLLETMKINEDKNKIYTPFGYIKKKDLEEE